MKILNLYAGIGGNRKLWDGDIEVTAVEIDPKIAKIYQDFFPNDKVIIADAHQYLLDHFQEFDFIWSSPPCPSHSRIRQFSAVASGQNKPIYPEMSLYQEIIFLQNNFKGKWVVENVIPYYEPLIKAKKIGRHLYWSNYPLTIIESEVDNIGEGNLEELNVNGFNLDKYKGIDKRYILRNCVNSNVGLHIFELAFKKPQKTLGDLK